MPIGPGDLIVLEPAPITSTTTRDYTAWDAYINSQGLVRFEGEGAQHSTTTLALRPARTDVGNNPQELRPESGDLFSQGDFSRGSLQTFFHRKSSDPAKYLYDEGFDVSVPGTLRHHNATLAASGGALAAGSTGRSAQSRGSTFVADGTALRVYSDITAAPTTQDPHAGEAATTVRDVTAEGDRLFVALGANGIHLRSAVGTWSHYNDLAATLVRFVKGRIVACTDRSVYEVTTSGAAPAAKLTMPEGWVNTDIGENGEFVYVTCVNEASGQSVVNHFGLDSSLAFVHKGTSILPDNELAYSIKGYLGVVLIGCGRKNASGGKDAVLYKASPSDSGFLPIDLVAESKGAGSRDLSVKCFATIGRKMLLGWTLGADSPYDQREGLAVYDPALDAFSHHLSSSTTTTTPDPPLSIQVFKGRIVFVTADGVYYEDTTRKVATAFLITSLATWGNAGLKVWDSFEITGKKLPATASVDVTYTTKSPDEGEFAIAGTWSTTDSTQARFRTQNLEAQKLALKIVSKSSGSQAVAPEIETYTVRSHPTVAIEEYRLIRTFRLLGRDVASESGETFHQNPRQVRDDIRALRNTFVAFYEADVPNGWDVRLVDVRDAMPFQPVYTTTTGDEPEKEAFLVTVVMEGSLR